MKKYIILLAMLTGCSEYLPKDYLIQSGNMLSNDKCKMILMLGYKGRTDKVGVDGSCIDDGLYQDYKGCYFNVQGNIVLYVKELSKDTCPYPAKKLAEDAKNNGN